MAAKISQIGGYRVRTERLCLTLAGLPLEPAEDDTGLAAAKRVFLTAAPLFRRADHVDSSHGDHALFEPLWRSDGNLPGDVLSGDGPPLADDHRLDAANLPSGDESEGGVRSGGRDNEADGRSGDLPAEDDPGGQGRAVEQLLSLVGELVGFAGQTGRPALLDLLLDLRRHRTPRRLPPSLVRLALPLALHRAGLVPKAAPGLLGGRLPLGRAGRPTTAASATEGEPVTAWLARALTALAKEAEAASGRLVELSNQYRAWHELLRRAGPRGHSRAPAVLDLLAITPVLSASLVAKHVGCTPQGASGILHQLAELGVLTQATTRSRWKIFLAADLSVADRDRSGAEAPLELGAALPEIDRDAIEQTLDELFANLERLDQRAKAALTSAGDDQGRVGGK